jgi:hypothetical protein
MSTRKKNTQNGDQDQDGNERPSSQAAYTSGKINERRTQNKVFTVSVTENAPLNKEIR